METVHIDGRDYAVELILKNHGRTASARFRDGRVIIMIPRRAPECERREIYENLLKRAARSIANGRWRERKKLELRNGDVLTILGKEYEFSVREGRNRKIKIEGDTIVARTPDENRITEKLGKLFLPEIEKRVHEINEMHFGAKISSVSLRNNRNRWGSCARSGRISLSTRLLFVPPEILDYVIVHELAHTKVKSHGKRFWQLIAKAMPDYLAKRRWLTDNDSEIPYIRL